MMTIASWTAESSDRYGADRDGAEVVVEEDSDGCCVDNDGTSDHTARRRSVSMFKMIVSSRSFVGGDDAHPRWSRVAITSLVVFLVSSFVIAFLVDLGVVLVVLFNFTIALLFDKIEDKFQFDRVRIKLSLNLRFFRGRSNPNWKGADYDDN